MIKLPIFYYPTTILSVDDDQLFLDAISYIISPDNPIVKFNNPHGCLTHLKNYVPPLTKLSLLIDCIDHDLHDTVNHSIVDFNVPALYQLKNYKEKTDEISVIIIDYDMPGMNGIEFCRSIKHLPMKKILLTGAVDHEAAVIAFNDNIIDRFIRKDSPTLAEELKLYIKALEQQYFFEQTQALSGHLESYKKMPFSDPVFANFFEEVCNRKHIHEYILVDKHGSVAMRDVNDNNFCLIIHTDESLDLFLQSNEEEIDKSFLEDIYSKKKIPFFGIGKEAWEYEPDVWGKYLYMAKMLQGRKTNYYYSIIEINN